MKKSQKKAIAIGAGAAALAAAATGVYFMTGKHAKNRKKVAKWMGDMQKEVIKELKKAGTTGEKAYNQAVDTVVKNYKTLRKVSSPELATAAAELKGSWDVIRKEAELAGRAVQRVAGKTGRARKAVKKAVKKVNKKSSRK
jgi:hypothetical protein